MWHHMSILCLNYIYATNKYQDCRTQQGKWKTTCLCKIHVVKPSSN